MSQGANVPIENKALTVTDPPKMSSNISMPKTEFITL
jgi:hypothetical protein